MDLESIIRMRETELTADCGKDATQFQRHVGCGTIVTSDQRQALHLFGLDDVFTISVLDATYRGLALVCHPDKPRGTETKFNNLKKAYKLLRPMAQRDTTTYDEMLRDRDQGVDIVKIDPRTFSQKFGEAHNSQSSWNGHGDWMKQRVPDAQQAPKQVTLAKFHNEFERVNKDKCGTIIKHVVGYLPSECTVGYADLHDNTESGFDGVGHEYSDLQRAYGETLLT
jgi:hypothetical protein